jgi:hypothetical protein
LAAGQKQKWEELNAFAEDCYRCGMDFDEIKENLFAKTDEEPLVYAIIKTIKSRHYAERRKQGTIIIAISGILMLSGFVITCFNFHMNQSVAFALYGLTGCGIVGVFWGLYKIIG